MSRTSRNFHQIPMQTPLLTVALVYSGSHYHFEILIFNLIALRILRSKETLLIVINTSQTMGSKRKKAEKQKDFTKAKLKVGKTAAKADNHTDTSFTAKTISLPNQSLNKKQATSALSTSKREEVDLTHQLSLTKHHSSDTRKEILNQIQQHLPSNPSLYKQILTSIIPLILDQSQKVRNALMALFSACAKKQPGLLDLHLRSIILFIHSGHDPSPACHQK